MNCKPPASTDTSYPVTGDPPSASGAVYATSSWRRGGQTLAMQTWRLKIVDASEGRIASLGRSWLRYALAWPSVLLGGIGLLWALVDRDRQFLHDRLAGTCIVLLPAPPKP